MKAPERAPKRGFTLIELLITIVIVSTLLLAALAPGIISVRGLGPGSATDQGRLALMAQGQAELFMNELSALSSLNWTAAVTELSAVSPSRVSPDPQVDGRVFQTMRSVICMQRDLKTPDVTCSSGYITATVVVTDSSTAHTFSISFVKTPAGNV